jgi:micrococcal nuclease
VPAGGAASASLAGCESRGRPTDMPRHPRAVKLTQRQRRLHYALRRARRWVLVLAALAAVILADQWGLFGRRPQNDYARCHGQAFRVARVIDGDTLDLDVPDGPKSTTRVRLWGVDTPETKHPRKGVQHFGPEAEAFTRNRCLGRTVTVQLVRGRTRDRYKRLLAYVILPDGTMLNRKLVELGYGYADPRYDHPYLAQFRQLQQEARSAGRGLWEAARPQDLPYYLRPERVSASP